MSKPQNIHTPPPSDTVYLQKQHMLTKEVSNDCLVVDGSEKVLLKKIRAAVKNT